jgi:hypothetical protein
LENHVRLLGLLNIAVGFLNGLIALFQLLFFGGAIILSIHLGVNTVVASVWLWSMLALVLPGIVIGIALLSFRGWARWAGIVLAICQLMILPLGTIVGLYGLWVLFSDDADMIFTRRYGQYVIGRR